MSTDARHLPPQALRDIRVLDFSHVIAGPFATLHLAQMGAEVIKIERPGGGDVMRHSAAGERAFTAFNAGKHLRTLDLASDDGRAEARALAAQVDVVVDNYRPGVLARHGLGYEEIRAVNPRVVYLAISGYGTANAERASFGAYDHVIQALSGMTMLAGGEGDPPIKTGFPVVDAATGIIGALAVVSALRERDRSGSGCYLDVSMWACALQLMYSFSCETLTTGSELPRVGNKGYSGSPAADTLRCDDGWISIGANTLRQVRSLMAVLGVDRDSFEPLLDTDDGSEAGFARARDPGAFRRLLQERVAGRSATALELQLNAAGVPAARVRTLREFTREAVASGLLSPIEFGTGASRATTPGVGWRTVR